MVYCKNIIYDVPLLLKYQSCPRAAAAASNKDGKAAEALQGRQPTTVTHACMNEGETFLYFLKSIKKEKQRSTEYTSNRSINPSKASCPSRTSHKPKQLDVSKEINSAQA